MTRPFSNTIFEDLKDSGTDVMLSVEPWQGFVGVKGSFPLEAAIRLEFHAKERVRKTREIVVVNARVDKACW